MQPIFTNDDTMRKLNVIHKLRKVLHREGKGYLSVLHRRVGVGLSEAEFLLCVKILETEKGCTITKGERDAVIVTITDACQRVIPVSPEEVIADACKEAQ